jgi:FkbM family methyltransferase
MLPHAAHVIIDAGANIGDTACWYLTRFPTATVVAIEPEPRNVVLLRKNVSFYGNRCKVIDAALWPRTGYLALREGDSEIAASVKEVLDPSEATCCGVSVPQIMSALNVSEVDILKCDIEGAEELLFSIAADEWLPRTKHIYCEVHNEGARLAVLRAARRHGFRWCRYRELYILSRDR